MSATSTASKFAVVFGGSGALGQDILKAFVKGGWKTICVDPRAPPAEIGALYVNLPLAKSMEEQGKHVLAEVRKHTQGDRGVSAMISVAGGFAMSTIEKDDLFGTYGRMFGMNVASAFNASYVAANCLNEGGLLSLTGATAANTPTPWFPAYGASKAAVHHLVKTLGHKDSQLPKNTTVLAIAPTTLDTPMNRSSMPDADFSKWTTTSSVAEKLLSWANDTESRPDSGSIVEV